MDLDLVSGLWDNDSSTISKMRQLGNIIKYVIRLCYGQATGRIYFQTKISLHDNLLIESSDVTNQIDTMIRDFLSKINLSNLVDPSEKKGFEHVGYGCFSTKILDKKILTQGNATFFFQTRERRKYHLMVRLSSIAKVCVGIKIEDKQLVALNINPLSKKTLDLIIEPDMIKNNISKIIITTDRLWSPHFLDENKIDVPVGIGISLIKIY